MKVMTLLGKVLTTLLVVQFLLPDFSTVAQIRTVQSPSFPASAPMPGVPSYQSSQSQRAPTNNDLIRTQNEQGSKMLGPSAPGAPTTSQRSITEVNEAYRKLGHQPIGRNHTIHPSEVRAKQIGRFMGVFTELHRMYKGELPFSLKKSVYLIENAYYDNGIPYSAFNARIADKVRLLESIMEKEQVARNSLGKNYIIQKLFSNDLTDANGTIHKHYVYDFDDPFGENDYSKMFVSKLLNSGKGQCNSMPLLYLILAEELKAKAWLSFAPNHSFIVFGDSLTGRQFNFEATNGYPISRSWAMQSGYISTAAIRNRIYLDTLSQAAMIAHLMAETLKGYITRQGYDDKIPSLADSIIKICPYNLEAHLLKANALSLAFKTAADEKGLTSYKQFDHYPEINKNYRKAQELYTIIDNLGYTPMPNEKYKEWLASSEGMEKRAERLKLKNIIQINARK